MERATKSWRARGRARHCQRGTSIVETVIALPILLVFVLGAIQFALIYEAKATLNHASLQAARLGAVRNASPDAIRRGLARGLAALHSPESSLAAFARTRAGIEADLASDARIRILNPTREAFDDFAVEVDGQREIPNDRLHARDTTLGTRSGVSLQDANLLKVQITYGYELQVPLVNWFIARVLLGTGQGTDPFEQQLLRRTRLPIMATATVRMQSPARSSDIVVARSDFPDLDRVPSHAGAPSTPGENDDGERDRPEDGAMPSGGEDSQDGAGLDEGFMGFGGGDPSGGDPSGSGGNGGAPGGGSSGGGVNGGTPLQCPVEPPNRPWFETSGAAESGASIEAVSLASLSVGNPIHVATGNKFQTETDLDALPGTVGIALQRHYNSSAVYEPSVLGAGWRHSYQTSLRRLADRIEIVQADGRLIVFSKDVSGADSIDAAHLVPRRASDGVLTVSADGYRWLWPTGRELVFDVDGRLLRMRADDGEILLRYTAGALHSVVDSSGRELRFEYYANGRLAKVRGPGGAGVAYSYDAAGNLVQAATGDGRARRYGYEDERHPHHLSSISVGSVRPRAFGERGTFERVATWRYDERGRAVYSSHPDDAGRVTLEFGQGYTDVTDAFGRTSRYVIGWKDAVAFVSEVRGPGCGSCGRSDVHYVYGDRFQLLSAVTPVQTLHYRYDADARLVQLDREVGGQRAWVARYAYDGSTSRVSRIERPSVQPGAVAVIEHAYAAGRIGRVRESGFSPDVDGYRPIMRELKISYDELGRMRRIDGPRTDADDWTHFDYDAVGRVVAIRTPGGARRVLAHDSSGRPTRIAQTGRPDLELRYDTSGRVLSMAELRAQGKVETSFAYDHAGRLTRIVDAQGRGTRYGFDSAGRPNRLWSSDSDVRIVARYAPDDRLERIAAFRASGQLLRALYYVYDAERRLIEVRDGDGQPLRQLAHLNGDTLPDRTTDPLGNTSAWAYDAFGRLVSTLAPDGGETRVEYDALDRMTRLTAPNDAATAYVYDDFGRRVLERSADRGETRYEYDAAGNLLQKTDARGETLRLAYDAANRLIQVKRAQGVTTLSYTDGLLARVEGEFADERYEYDRDAQLVMHRRTIDGRAFTSRFSYDSRGRLATRELPSGARLRYRYASNGALQSIVQERWLSDRMLVRTNDDASAQPGRLDARESLVFGNGLALRTTHDARSGNPLRREIEGVARLAYEHDDAGQIRSIRRDDDVREYDYDVVGRLWKASTPRGVFQFMYDTNGNRMSSSTPSPAQRGRAGEGAGAKDETPSALVTYEYEQGTNRLAGIPGDKRYTYDAAGNPLTIGERRYEYDASGRPTRLFESGRLVAEYRYNFWGERVQKVLHENGGRIVTSYIYEQQKLIAEADERGNVLREYVYLDHHPVAVLTRGRAYWIHTDHLGTPLAVTNDRRSVVWRAEHHPFGGAVIDADPDGDQQRFTLNLRFPGQYADAESGTYYNYFRDYDPETGRYLTADPLGYADGTNAYLYVQGNPSTRIDNLGLYQQDIHYYMTLFLAVTVGVDPITARNIALASAFLDENPSTRPVDPASTPSVVSSLTSNQSALVRYHFVLSDLASGQTLRNYRNGNTYLPATRPSPQLVAMREYFTAPPVYRSGLAVCSAEDVHIQFFGEYLHAFADTFAHRDQRNVPYDAWFVELGVGHGLAGSRPDYTYNDEQWQTRESRTHSMELLLRDQIRESPFADINRAITDRQLDLLLDTLHAFNSTREDEENSIEIRSTSSPDMKWVNTTKVQILNQALLQLGYEGIDLTSSEFRFDLDLARRRRLAAFEDLDPSAYPRAILSVP